MSHTSLSSEISHIEANANALALELAAHIEAHAPSREQLGLISHFADAVRLSDISAELRALFDETRQNLAQLLKPADFQGSHGGNGREVSLRPLPPEEQMIAKALFPSHPSLKDLYQRHERLRLFLDGLAHGNEGFEPAPEVFWPAAERLFRSSPLRGSIRYIGDVANHPSSNARIRDHVRSASAELGFEVEWQAPLPTPEFDSFAAGWEARIQAGNIGHFAARAGDRENLPVLYVNTDGRLEVNDGRGAENAAGSPLIFAILSNGVRVIGVDRAAFAPLRGFIRKAWILPGMEDGTQFRSLYNFPPAVVQASALGAPIGFRARDITGCLNKEIPEALGELRLLQPDNFGNYPFNRSFAELSVERGLSLDHPVEVRIAGYVYEAAVTRKLGQHPGKIVLCEGSKVDLDGRHLAELVLVNDGTPRNFHLPVGFPVEISKLPVRENGGLDWASCD